MSLQKSLLFLNANSYQNKLVGARGFEPRSAGFSGSELQRLIPQISKPARLHTSGARDDGPGYTTPPSITLKPTPTYKLYDAVEQTTRNLNYFAGFRGIYPRKRDARPS